MLSAMAKKNFIPKALKFALSGLSLFFVGILFFIVVYDALTGASSETITEYCKKYGFLASPKCW
jgi:hypothetical protein